ncbi:MAG: prephenate dehydratase [Lachnospiraceae bacterium]|nr:prephenate dehydratase [Lachnospiraceae bacterium]
MGKININDLEIYANHGVMEEEQRLGQKFLVSITLEFDMEKAVATDDIEKTVNYAALSHQAESFFKDNTFKLIETAAGRLASELLLTRPQVKSIEVTVKKPWAPIGIPLEYVSATEKRTWHEAVISIGSNMGDKAAYLDLGIDTLRKHGIIIKKTSSYITTKPYGYTDQDDFLNACVRIKTVLDPHSLLDVCHEAEKAAGRERLIHWGPRTLDLDIISYDRAVINDSNLTIPHPQMHLRDFVLRPMAEVYPDWKHPLKNMTVKEMLDRLPPEGIRKSEFSFDSLEFKDAIEKTNVKVIYFGTAGSYSQAAMFSYFGHDIEYINMVDWDKACDALTSGQADYAVFPIENSNAGMVTQMFDALVNKDVYITHEIFLPVSHCLIGLPGTDISEIDTVYSHPQALMQCGGYLKAHENWKCISMENTAVAAGFVVKENNRHYAAIASAIAAEQNRLAILDSGINDNKNNVTRFAILSARPIVTRTAKKISICIELAHESGSLYKLLSYISVFGLNMTKIESRPIPGRNFEYRFFIDFDGDMTMSDVASALTGIKQNAKRFWFLGNY